MKFSTKIILNNFIQGQLTLNFVLTCTIKLGTAPTDADCQARYDDDNSSGLENPGRAGRRRRKTEKNKFTQTTGFFGF